MLTPETNVRYIKGIGEAKARAFARLGVDTAGDLMEFFPRAYEDRSVIKPVARLVEGEAACVRVMITTEPELSRPRRGLELLRFHAADGTGRHPRHLLQPGLAQTEAAPWRELYLLREGEPRRAQLCAYEPGV